MLFHSNSYAMDVKRARKLHGNSRNYTKNHESNLLVFIPKCNFVGFFINFCKPNYKIFTP
jgi:hypothetical protein